VRGKRILTLNDDSVEGRLCTDLYSRLRDSLLRGHPWNFNKQRASLAILVDVPVWEYENTFQLPSDLARILKTDIPYDQKWAREGNTILANRDAVNILYGKKITDASLFDDQFSEVLAWKLASEICYPITQNASRSETVANSYKEMLREARSMNAQERGSIEQVTANEWLDVRY
jgi:hypothetical protein